MLQKIHWKDLREIADFPELMTELDGTLKLVEIELFNYCNRKCSFCPNETIDRKTNFIALSESSFINVLKDLKDKEFAGYISFSRYNEPLSHINLLKKRALQVREYLPKVTTIFNTNGDFLSKDKLKMLSVDEISIMDYDHKGLEKCIERMERTGIKILESDYPFIKGKFENISILYYVDFVENHILMNDRGGVLKQYSLKEKRTAPCLEPERFAGIDYNGNMMACCVTRSDIKSHKNYILGNINEKSITDIFNSPKAIRLRKNASEGNFTEDMKPCHYCPYKLGRYRRDKVELDYEKGTDY
jgi:MoaA/NifB/PqqE/SkfB family radical SAM enzyme|tara:strand:- start:1429 stop:2334 length:906 start_codon:yes stop_codon:yes gene_type:complete